VVLCHIEPLGPALASAAFLLLPLFVFFAAYLQLSLGSRRQGLHVMPGQVTYTSASPGCLRMVVPTWDKFLDHLGNVPTILFARGFVRANSALRVSALAARAIALCCLVPVILPVLSAFAFALSLLALAFAALVIPCGCAELAATGEGKQGIDRSLCLLLPLVLLVLRPLLFLLLSLRLCARLQLEERVLLGSTALATA